MIPCAQQALDVGEPLAGTAPMASAWVVIEQPGSWGAKALLESDLPAGIGPVIAEASSGTGVSVLLARHPDRTIRDQRAGTQGHRVWVARVRPGAHELRTGILEDLADVAAWDFPSMAEGNLPGLDWATSPALLLVCTQGRRDACCARIGRPMLEGLLDRLDPGARTRVWESSHIGGHRFAPTVLALPTGTVHGRLDPAHAHHVLNATEAEEIELIGLRGRTSLPPAAQAADIAIRELTGERAADALAFTSLDADGDQACIRIVHRDGRRWSVRLRQADLASPRPESCGAEPRIGTTWHVLGID